MQNNSVRFGPGIWHSIHMLAYTSRTYPERLRFLNMIYTLVSGIDCLYCWHHADANLRSISPCDPKYWQPGDEMGMFRWSVDFHNHVNSMLNKPKFDYLEALRKYDRLYHRNPDDGSCNECRFPSIN